MCGGTHFKMNGKIGRIPYQPDNHVKLKELSILRSIEHGLEKLRKYKNHGYETVLSLEDISGQFYTADIVNAISLNIYKKEIDTLIDYIITFISNQDEMIVANIWKEKEMWYIDQIPYNRRFSHENGNWVPLER